MKGPLPQLKRLVLTDGGLETDLIYHHGIDLPCFASVVLLGTVEGQAALEAYYRPYLELAHRLGTGSIPESRPRACQPRLGYAAWAPPA